MSQSEITTDAEYEGALERMDRLFDDYDTNRAAIERLAGAIERWEDQAKEFAEFNAAIAAIYKEGAPESAQKTDAAADVAAH